MRQRRSSDRYEPITDPSADPVWRTVRTAENTAAASLEELRDAEAALESERLADTRLRRHHDERLRRIRLELRARGE
jgi:hypothetical protein